MEFQVEDHPDPLDVELLEAQIRAEASTATGLGDEVELAIFVREAGSDRRRHQRMDLGRLLRAAEPLGRAAPPGSRAGNPADRRRRGRGGGARVLADGSLHLRLPGSRLSTNGSATSSWVESGISRREPTPSGTANGSLPERRKETVTANDPESGSSTYQPPVKKSSRTLAWGIGAPLYGSSTHSPSLPSSLRRLRSCSNCSGQTRATSSRVDLPQCEPHHRTVPRNLSNACERQLGRRRVAPLAIIMYALFALLVNVLIDYIDRRRDQSIGRDRYEEQQAALRAGQSR